MTVRALVLAMASLTLLAGHLGAQCDTPGVRAATEARHRAARSALLDAGARFAVSRDSLFRRFGLPLMTRTALSHDPGAAGADSVTRVTYPSFAVQYVKPFGAENEVVYLAEVSGSDEPVTDRVVLGMTHASAVALLGRESQRETRGDTLSICLLISGESEAEEYAVLEFVREVLVRVRWLFYWS